MHPSTVAALVDELTKIATNPEAPLHTNASVPPQDDQDKNPDFSQIGGNPTPLPKKVRADQSETPASKANAFFGLPLGQPRKPNTRMYDAGSTAASSPDRSQSPVDGQSTANISQGGAQYPQTGPGGV
jgi:hypothetical protein